MILALTGVPLVIVSVIAFIIILGLIIVVHEGGHFFFAKKAGILCHEFSIGMGPVIWKKKYGETLLCIRAIPIGGFVSMADEVLVEGLVKKGNKISLNFIDDKISEILLDEKATGQISGEVVDFDILGKDGNPLFITINDGMQDRYFEIASDAFFVDSKNQRLQITPYDRCFDSKSLLARFLTLVAGAGMNFVLAIIIYLIVSFAVGVPDLDSNVIGSVSAANSNLIVEVEGENTYKLLPGDTITNINGDKITSWNDVSVTLEKLVDNNQTTVDMVILRDGKEITLDDVECYTYIASIGISNIQFENKDFPNGVNNGVILGNIGMNYLDSDNVDYAISAGDIITKVRIDTVNSDKTIVKGTPVDVTSWSQLISLFKDVNVVNVQFEYYSYEKKGIVSLDECAIFQTYGNELLENQRIEKIQVKIGISPEQRFKFFGCVGEAFKAFWSDFTLIFRTLGILIAPQSGFRQVGVSDLSGFVGIFGMIMSFVSSGFLSLLSFMALLSVNIGVMNLLPIPALDGGRVVFLGYELITRKKPSKKVETIINNVFFILLMILFVYVTFNDIFRLF